MNSDLGEIPALLKSVAELPVTLLKLGYTGIVLATSIVDS